MPCSLLTIREAIPLLVGEVLEPPTKFWHRNVEKEQHCRTIFPLSFSVLDKTYLELQSEKVVREFLWLGSQVRTWLLPEPLSTLSYLPSPAPTIYSALHPEETCFFTCFSNLSGWHHDLPTDSSLTLGNHLPPHVAPVHSSAATTRLTGTASPPWLRVQSGRRLSGLLHTAPGLPGEKAVAAAGLLAFPVHRKCS